MTLRPAGILAALAILAACGLALVASLQEDAGNPAPLAAVAATPTSSATSDATAAGTPSVTPTMPRASTPAPPVEATALIPRVLTEVRQGGSSGSGEGGAEEPAPVLDGARLVIPAIGVDAPVLTMGFNAQGQLEVPWTAYDVGWYSLSAKPGAPGNALMGGHLNWAGDLGVFDRLSELQIGALIHVDTPSGRATYEVERTHYIAYDSPFEELLGLRAGQETLTLFTCGGTFDQSRREYNERFVVRAVLVDQG